MSRFKTERAKEQEPRKIQERVREVPKESVLQEYAQLVDTLDPSTNEISYPEALPEGADEKTKWEHTDQMEIAFTKVLARVGGAAREVGDLLVGRAVSDALSVALLAKEALERVRDDDLGEYYKRKQALTAAEQALEQVVKAREAHDGVVRKKLSVVRDAVELVRAYQEDSKTKNVMDYFNRRSGMIEQEGLPAEVAPPTLPEMRAITRSERPHARRKQEKEVDTLGETLIKTPEDLRREVGHSDTMLASDTNRETTSFPSADVVAKRIESIGGTYKMQQDVIEAGGRVLARVARLIREAGVLYGNAERKAA